MKKSKTYSEPQKTESLMDFFPQLRTIPEWVGSIRNV